MGIRDEFKITRQGKTVVLFAGLLEEAHSQGLRSIETELLHFEMDESGEPVFALVKAKVRMESGTFEGIGDATRSNVGRSIVPHLIRMAETRAKARALRDATNIGMASLEEMGDEDDSGQGPQKTTSGARRAQGGRRAAEKIKGRGLLSGKRIPCFGCFGNQAGQRLRTARCTMCSGRGTVLMGVGDPVRP